MRRIMSTLAAGAVAVTGLPSPSYAATGFSAMTATMTIPCYGCGVSSGGTMAGSATGVIDGTVTSAPFTANFTYTSSPNTCPLAGAAVGTYTWGPYAGVFDVINVGATAAFWIKLPDGTWIHQWGVAAVTSPLGNPCGSAATMNVAVAGVTEP